MYYGAHDCVGSAQKAVRFLYSPCLDGFAHACGTDGFFTVIYFIHYLHRITAGCGVLRQKRTVSASLCPERKIGSRHHKGRAQSFLQKFCEKRFRRRCRRRFIHGKFHQKIHAELAEKPPLFFFCGQALYQLPAKKSGRRRVKSKYHCLQPLFFGGQQPVQ